MFGPLLLRQIVLASNSPNLARIETSKMVADCGVPNLFGTPVGKISSTGSAFPNGNTCFQHQLMPIFQIRERLSCVAETCVGKAAARAISGGKMGKRDDVTHLSLHFEFGISNNNQDESYD